ncbi:MAG: TonB-dependent receptor [Alphaproteobacteria bacterium]|nr:TonB-dependent receptor [Alphaproteobacteria bacterium]
MAMVLNAQGVTAQTVSAQEAIALPQITVNAPSPIVRGPGLAQPAAPAEPTLQGTLPIVADQFATVTVVPAEEIQRTPGATLGDLLMTKPGITGSSYAPGAASRPIVRGLDTNRVRIQENGIGVGDVSHLGEDHAVPIDPLSARQVEVIRGPATLRFGSQAIGGVVEASNNRIPTAIPPRGFAAELNGGWTSVDNGLEGSVLLDVGKGPFAIHADAFARGASDYGIPKYPYLFPPDPAPAVGSHQPNSAARADGQSIGGSYLFGGGFVGMAVSRFASFYRVPGIESAETRTRIDLEQTKVTAKGEFRPQHAAIESLRFWAGHTDYRHNEIALEDGSDAIHQTFTNKSHEGRAELQFAPFHLNLGALTTAIGVQGSRQSLTAPGEEAGLFDPNTTKSIAGYIFNELKVSDTLRFQFAGRIESVNVTGSTPDLFVDPNVTIARDRSFTPVSAAAGVLKSLPWGLVGSLTGQYVERAPRAPELLSRGNHHATETFDIGNPNLNIEVAHSVEAGLRKPNGRFRFEATAYHTWFNGFIFRRLTGVRCGHEFASCGVEDELAQAIYTQRDADFRGGEFQFQWDVHRAWNGFFGVDGQYDIVRATFTDGTNVPRIPPQRIGGGVYFRSAEWLARLSLLHAMPQNRIAETGETTTRGYSLLKAELVHTRTLKNHPAGVRQVTVGVVGNNLLDEEVRNHVSFRKNEVPMPGASMKLFGRIAY